MRSKNPELKDKIISYIDLTFRQEGATPTIRNIAGGLGVSKSLVASYLKEMRKEGRLEKNDGWRGTYVTAKNKALKQVEYLPIVGSVACGPLLLAEQNIDSYLPISIEMLGSGTYFCLTAQGDSMINAGISNGDLVIVRIQNTANEGDIVVARVEDEATLKRYYVDKQKKCIRLHPENDNLQDMFYENVEIQGVAVKVIKDLA